MTCVSARNLFTLCNSIISSDFLYKTLKFSRPFSASAACYLKEVHVKTENNVTVVEGVLVESDRKGKVLNVDSDRDLCPLCPQKIKVPVKYTDVLIISQFIQEDGEVLPPHVTGLCYKAHQRLQRVVRQAQYAGLIPEPETEEPVEQPKHLYDTGYKWRQFNIFYDD